MERTKFFGWRMVAIAFLAQNCAIGLFSSSYGTVLGELQSEMKISRAAASSAIGVTFLVLGLLSPVVGGLLQRISIRNSMTAGACLNAAGFAALAFTNQFPLFLAIFAVLIGPGCCMLGVLPATTLVSRWFEKDRGKALAITNVPFFILLVPPIAARIVTAGGRQLLFIVLAGVFVAIIPLLRRVVDHPADIGQVQRQAFRPSPAPADGKPAAGTLRTADVLRDVRFWMLSATAGVLTGTSTIFVTHAVSMATDRGVALTAAATLLSAFGSGTVFGAAIFGWLIDRIGSFPSLALNVIIQAVVWFSLIFANDYFAMLALGSMIGACSGALVALHSAALNELYGQANFSKAMGFSYFLKIPFLFGSAPLAGYLFDLTGNYGAALTVVSGSLAVCALLVFPLALARRSSAARMV